MAGSREHGVIVMPTCLSRCLKHEQYLSKYTDFDWTISIPLAANVKC